MKLKRAKDPKQPSLPEEEDRGDAVEVVAKEEAMSRETTRNRDRPGSLTIVTTQRVMHLKTSRLLPSKMPRTAQKKMPKSQHNKSQRSQNSLM